MSSKFGHRNTGRAKAIGGGILAGLVALGEAAHDGPLQKRINEIDEQLIELKKERDYLINELYEPGDLRVGDDFDPMWRPKGVELDTTTAGSSTGNNARFVECKGRDTYGVRHTAHPACPFKDELHVAHDFRWDG